MAIVTSLLILINSYLVGRIVAANWIRIPDFFQDVRLFQAAQIFVPMVLVMIQFVIYDRIRDALMSRASQHRGKSSP